MNWRNMLPSTVVDLRPARPTSAGWSEVRAKQRGAKPGITDEGVMGPNKEKNDEQWLFSRVEATVGEKRKLLAKGKEGPGQVAQDAG